MALAAIEVLDDDLNENSDIGYNSAKTSDVATCVPPEHGRFTKNNDHSQGSSKEEYNSPTIWSHFRLLSNDKTRVECLISKCGLLFAQPPGFSPTKLLAHLQTKHKNFYETTVRRKFQQRSNSSGLSPSFDRWSGYDIFSTHFTFDKAKFELTRLKTLTVSFNRYKLHVPLFLVDAFNLICLNVKTEGLFHVGCNANRIKHMRYTFFGDFGIPEYCTLYDICGLVAYFLRHMKEPIFTQKLEPRFLELGSCKSDLILSKLKSCLNSLPLANRDTLIYLAVKLKYVSSFHAFNEASTNKIADYFVKSFFRQKFNLASCAELNLRLKSVMALMDYVGFILAEKDSAVFKRPNPLPVTIHQGRDFNSSADIPSKQIDAILTKREPTTDAIPINDGSNKEIILISDDITDMPDLTGSGSNQSLHFLDQPQNDIELFPPGESIKIPDLSSSAVFAADDSGACSLEKSSCTPAMTQICAEPITEKSDNGEQSSIEAATKIYNCPYCVSTFRTPLLQSYHLRQKHPKLFLGPKTQIGKRHAAYRARSLIAKKRKSKVIATSKKVKLRKIVNIKADFTENIALAQNQAEKPSTDIVTRFDEGRLSPTGLAVESANPIQQTKTSNIDDAWLNEHQGVESLQLPVSSSTRADSSLQLKSPDCRTNDSDTSSTESKRSSHRLRKPNSLFKSTEFV